jgi:hypothetical protein
MGIPAKPPLIRRNHNRPGIALPAAIFGIVIVSLLTAAAWTITELDTKATTNRVDAAAALRLAHTAETHALSVLRTKLKDTTFSRMMRGYDNLPLTRDDGLIDGYPVLGDSLSIPAEGRVVPGAGTYYVRIIDDPKDSDGLPFVDSNRRLLIRCRGVTTRGSSAELNVIVSNFVLPAIAVDGDLEISSKPIVSGACGGIHANGNITGGGVATVSTSVTATGTVSLEVSGTKFSNQPKLEIPDFNPSDFCGSASYVYIGSGSSNYSSGSPMGTWKPKNSDIKPGMTYCVSGNVEFQEDFGGPGAYRTSSIIATGSIKVGGKKVWLTAAHPDDIVLMAGGDLDLQGEAGFEGLVYGGGQCYVSDKLSVNGPFICKDKDPHPGADYVQSSVLISGDGKFNFDCNSMMSTAFGVVAWYPTIGS